MKFPNEQHDNTVIGTDICALDSTKIENYYRMRILSEHFWRLFAPNCIQICYVWDGNEKNHAAMNLRPKNIYNKLPVLYQVLQKWR